MLSKNKKTKTQVKQAQSSESTDHLSERIQKKAYELYEKRGCCHGRDYDDWYEAERIVKS